MALSQGRGESPPQLMTPDAIDKAALTRTPQVKVVRRALDLTQEQFAARYQIPLGTLRDWSKGGPNLTNLPAPT